MVREYARAVVLLGLWPLLVCAAAAPQPPETAKVIQVFDGDTLVLAGGDRVRLVDINTPEGPHDGNPAEPFADEARARLKQLTLNQTITLVPSRKPRDVYGRRLAHIYVGTTWVNGLLVEEGLATAYTFADNAMKADAVLKLEQQARAAKRGMWALPRWQVRNATTCCAATDMGKFQIVAGKILSSGGDKDHIYLNFGPDYRTDFTVRITRKDAKRYFAKQGIKDIAKAYVGHKVRVHGPVVPVYGAMVVVSHPAQLEVLD